MKPLLKKFTRSLLSLAILATAFTISNCYAIAYADIGILPCPHWYLNGNIGVSHAHDNPFSGTNNRVEENGPGWNVNTGINVLTVCQLLFGGELGYTQYADSREYAPGSILVGRTEHYSVYGALTALYPLMYNFGILGKAGVAYSYARKNAYPTNLSRSADPYSPYGALGLTYNVTCKAAVVLQAARDWGNGKTGSMDLYSFGVIYNLT